MRRMRLVAWRVQPVVMLDDGETLTPLAVRGIEVPAAGWAAFKAGGDTDALDDLRSQIEVGD